jgi:hypothetical protein
MNTATPDDTTTEDDSVTTVEVWIRHEIYDAAMLRARRQGEKLAAVARAGLFTAAAEARPLTGFVLVKDSIPGPQRFAARDIAEHAAADDERVVELGTPEAVALGIGKVRPRPYGEVRRRIRFSVPKETKQIATEQIEASGEGVPAAIERHLLAYTDTGTIITTPAAAKEN